MNVMLVDDDARLRMVLGRLLRSIGIIIIHEAADGEEALQALTRVSPQLIITDLHMPQMDGITFVRALRGGGNRTPVIMISGHNEPHDIVIAMRAGVDNFLPKPINPDILFEKISQTMGTLRLSA